MVSQCFDVCSLLGAGIGPVIFRTFVCVCVCGWVGVGECVRVGVHVCVHDTKTVLKLYRRPISLFAVRHT